MSTFKISIIVPTYHCVERINDVISCLQQQTIGFQSLEILLSDDGSFDGTAQKNVAFSAQYANVFSLQLPRNSGFAGAPRNAALHAATAPYVMFLDSDDSLPPDACALLYDEIERTKTDMAFGYCRRVSQNGTVIQEIPPAYANIPAHISTLPDELERELIMRDSFSAVFTNAISLQIMRFPSPSAHPGKIFIFCTAICYNANRFPLLQHLSMTISPMKCR